MSLQIIIAERGWVFVGDCSRDGDQLIIANARNVRRWGTTSGLGQLAKDGPQAETQLDDYGTVRIHVLAVVAAIECDPAKWAPKGKNR
jgi:hypothetical protein